MLSEVSLQEFKKIYLEEFGENISDERALELGSSILSLFDKIYRPVKKEWSDTVYDKEKISSNQKFSNH